MKYSFVPVLGKCANYEGEDRGQGKIQTLSQRNLYFPVLWDKVLLAEPCWPAMVSGWLSQLSGFDYG